MNIIYVKMLGNFNVTMGNEKVLFPYNKVQALFCYLIINKECTREKLAGLLWPEEEENIAKKNLRNAIYKIKKAFNLEILISPRKSTVMINPDIQIKTDVDDFLNNKDELNPYKGHFLTGFYVKNAENFQTWMLETREHFQQIYINRLRESISIEKENKNYSKVETYCKALIKMDEFDEEPYIELMKSLKSSHKYNKAVEVYHKLSEILNRELNVEPQATTKKLFNEILNEMSLTNCNLKSKEFFFGRYEQLKYLEDVYLKFKDDISGKSILILGEAGIGKTKLKEKFLESISKDNIFILETSCYQFEKEYILKPWNNIILKLSKIIKMNNISIPLSCENIIASFFPEFSKNYSGNLKLIESNNLKYEIIGNALGDILKIISSHKKILLVFEDIQWLDSMSLSLLNSVLLSESKNIILISTCRNEYNEELDKFITSMNRYNKLNTIKLERLNHTETEDFIKKALPNYNLSKKMANKIYSETEGNLFFLTEYMNIIKSNGNINLMSSKMQDILRSRYLDVSEEGRKILNICSMFFDEVPLDILASIIGKDELEIIDVVEELENKFILKEILNDNNISLKFTHQKFREFIYSNQSMARKKILHNKIGELLEKNIVNDKNDLNTYYKLIYHFSNSNNHVKELKYSMKNLNIYLSFSHELFPVLHYGENKYSNLYFNDEKTLKSLEKVEKLLAKVENQSRSKETVDLEITFLLMKGRYLIKIGEYENGTSIIKNMIDKALNIDALSYAIEGYKQMIYYCIQTYNVENMIMYINLALAIAKEQNYEDEKAIILKLKALYNNMCGNYKEAEKLLNESINIFTRNTITSDKYVLNIAACYNYIGEIRRHSLEFSKAICYYDKAIKICEGKGVMSSTAIFSINAGETAFDMGNYAAANDYFKRSLNIYNHFDLVWGRSVAEAFMALLKINEKNYTKALSYLKDAHTHSEMLKSPHEIGLVYRVKAEISTQLKENEKLNSIFKEYLPKDAKNYCDMGIAYLKKSLDNYEIDVLMKLKDKI
ncbi:AAA family ATPase [Clostridium coskatii]|uniref:Bacterial transcriptional activator domain protein n=1 Tax=Clostridium coskatii TaxID=1705578 RepID=A0A166UIG9_9CLOT|nr:AAA family ATPase [Clostridium coskatii]OAA94956.1 Bacterial transcriptional activator domain protein [Clostridium coskatii]OBR91697.1 bacterial transcriptional activator domain protein [Clostridium coskatii]